VPDTELTLTRERRSPGPMPRDRALLEWARRLPKVELHVHLEGSIPAPTLTRLIGKHEPGAVPGPEELAERFSYRDFAHFIRAFQWKNGYLREADDFTLIAEAVAREMAAQRIRYAEAYFSPTDFAVTGLAPQELAAAIRRGLDRVPGIEIALIADLVRDTGPRRGAITLEQVAEVRELGVIGITIGGSEQSFPAEPYGPIFERARQLGLRTTAHAGEAAGPESVRAALDVLRVERIGHGTRAAADPGLVERLAAERVPLEQCPVSNLRTGVVARLEDHPIRGFAERGVLVTVNTDDPAMFDTDLSREYALLVERLGFTPAGIKQLILNAVEASWLPDGRKHRLTGAIVRDPAWTAPEPGGRQAAAGN
jgi:adenosine deaminase